MVVMRPDTAAVEAAAGLLLTVLPPGLVAMARRELLSLFHIFKP
jgi:hypothetical protein